MYPKELDNIIQMQTEKVQVLSKSNKASSSVQNY